MRIKNQYDVIVVGCGPAGSSTAKSCAEQGLDVLVLDRNLEIGTPVRCGEGISDNSVKELRLKIPSSCIAQKIYGAVAYSPSEKSVHIKFPGTKGYIIERKMFDKWLAKQSSLAGATIIAHSNVVDIIKKGDYVAGVKAEILGEQNREISSSIVVAADGVESLVLRKSGIKSEKKPLLVDSGYQYEMENIKLKHPSLIELYFGNKIAKRGYVWVFPKSKTSANVGIGIAGASERSAKAYLDEWIAKHEMFENASIIEVNGGCIPVGGLMKNMTGNGIIGIGDAVNQVNPIHGGGIAESIKASRIAGPIIASAIKKGDVSGKFLARYDREWWDKYGNKLKNVEKVREYFEKLTRKEGRTVLISPTFESWPTVIPFGSKNLQPICMVAPLPILTPAKRKTNPTLPS